MRRFIVICLITLLWADRPPPVRAAAALVECATIESRYEALKDGEARHLRDLFIEARDLSDCGAGRLDALAHTVADAYVADAETLFAAGAELQEVEHDFRQSLVFRKDWRIYERLGDAAAHFDEYVSAALSYMYAVHTIGNMDVTVTAPTPEETERVLRKFSAVWGVADYYERPLPILFGGSWSRAWHREITWATALGVEPLRGHRVSSPLLAVTFKFASSELTRHGQETLVVVRELLGRLGSPDIRLAGRAGEHERDAAMDLDLGALAQARAETVKAWLEGWNYKGAILIEPSETATDTSIADEMALPERVADGFERRVDYSWEGGPELPGGSLSR